MTYKNYLIFDFGASGGKAFAARFDGKKFDMEEVHRFDNNPVSVSGTLYWDILNLFLELKNGIQLAVKKYKKISGLAIDTWGCDFGFIDSRGKLLANPVNYRDEERNSRVKEVCEIIPEEELFKLTGAPVLSVMSIFHLYSLKKGNAPELNNAHKFLMMPDLFNYFLTGEICNEFTNATTTLFYNQKEKDWEDYILNRLGVSKNIFSPTVMPGTQIGSIQNELKEELEIISIPVIVPATEDTSSAVAGIPVTEKKQNWAYLSLGTWGIMGIETPEPVLNDETFKSGYANLGEPEGRNTVWKAITGFWIIQQCRERWIKEKGESITWDDIVSASLSARPFVSFINVDDPVFGQTHVNMPKVIADYCKKNNQIIPSSIGEISRCVYESLAMRFRYNLEILEGLSERGIKVIYVVGGGAKNKVLCQWTANATRIPVLACEVETTSVGNLLMQLKGTDEISNLEEGRLIAKKSIQIIIYEPVNTNKWEGAYRKYLKIV